MANSVFCLGPFQLIPGQSAVGKTARFLRVNMMGFIEADRDTIALKQEETAKQEGFKAETEEAQSANGASLDELGTRLAFD